MPKGNRKSHKKSEKKIFPCMYVYTLYMQTAKQGILLKETFFVWTYVYLFI